MKRSLFLVLLFLFPFLSTAQQKENLRKDVCVLSSDSLEGRKVGTIGGEKARGYICSQLRDISLEYTTQVCHKGLGQNIIAEIKAETPKFKDEYILIGAHYDHLGVRNGKIYNGADDNASGSAVLLQLARLFKANKDKLDRNIILVWFDAEEIGLIGSKHFVKDSAYANKIGKIKLMINLDMVGWYKNGSLKISGVKMLRGWETIFKQTERKIHMSKIFIPNFSFDIVVDGIFSDTHLLLNNSSVISFVLSSFGFLFPFSYLVIVLLLHSPVNPNLSETLSCVISLNCLANAILDP